MSEDLQKKLLALFEQYETCVVDFNKVNGDNRKMVCTRSADLIPQKEHKDTDRKQPTTSIAAFDLNKQEWRAFKVELVNSISVCEVTTGKTIELFKKEQV